MTIAKQKQLNVCVCVCVADGFVQFLHGDVRLVSGIPIRLLDAITNSVRIHGADAFVVSSMNKIQHEGGLLGREEKEKASLSSSLSNFSQSRISPQSTFTLEAFHYTLVLTCRHIQASFSRVAEH